MLTNALRAGIPLDVFLTSTFWEVSQMIDAALWRMRNVEYRIAVTQAWHTAALAGAAFSGKLPALASLFVDEVPQGKREPITQTREEQIAILKALAAAEKLKEAS